MTSKIAHLEMIQGVINRQSNNSFLLKGWSVVLVSAMFALAANESEMTFVYLAYFPCLAFWGLDGYFLQQERLFRALYDHARQVPEEAVDFAMDTSVINEKIDSWLTVTRSNTLAAFHGTLLGSIVLVMFVGIVS